MMVATDGAQDTDFKASGRILLRLSKEYSVFSDALVTLFYLLLFIISFILLFIVCK
jgi:hypothetical protein